MRARRVGRGAGLAGVLTMLLVGCQTPPACDRATVSGRLEGRTGYTLGGGPGRVVAPPGLCEGRPLTEDEAVLLALWNNAAFQELLTDLDLSRADLVQAGLLPNPEVIYTFPVPQKAYKYLVDFP